MIGEPVVFTVVLVEVELEEPQAAASRPMAARLAMTLNGFRNMFPPGIY
jgi:hypothetical protein